MYKDIKFDFAVAFAIALTILTFGFCGPADAQTTQPVYTRPSKGAPLTVYNLPAPQASPTTSVTFDWTAFSSADVSFTLATATGGRCACPSGVNNCVVTFNFNVLQSTSKTGPFGSTDSGSAVFGAKYQPATTGPFVAAIGQFNIANPYAQFSTQFVSYVDSGAGNAPVAGCVLTMSVTPIPFTNRVEVEGPYPGAIPALSRLRPMMSGGVDYIALPGTTESFSTEVNRVNADGVVAVGFGSGSPILPATSPVAVNAATLVFTSSQGRTGVRLQNVGANPALCAAGTNAASVSATRYSFALAAPTAVGNGGVYDVQQLPVFGSGASGLPVYCLGSGGATSIAILPY